MRVRYIPNILTFLRIVLTLSLLFIRPVLGTFSVLIFITAGLTDMLDGPIARRVKDGSSEFGAEFDSIADMLMVIVSVFLIVPAMNVWGWIFPTVLFALGFKLMSAVPGLIKHRKVFFLHTISNKILAMMLFFAVIFYTILGESLAVNIYFTVAIASVFVITLEEMIIIAKLNHPNKNIKSIFHVRQVNEEYEKQMQAQREVEA